MTADEVLVFETVDTPAVRRPGDYRRRGADGPPYVLDPDGELTRGGKVRSRLYGRPSGFHEWIDRPYALPRWGEARLVEGVLAGAELDPADLAGSAVKAKRAGGAFADAERGTYFHAVVHGLHGGPPPGAPPPELGLSPELVAAATSAYLAGLDRWGLEVVASEIHVVDDEWRLAGTADLVVRLRRALVFGAVAIPAGVYSIGDLKTGGLEVVDGEPQYWAGYAVQVASYSHGVPYVIDGEYEERGEWPWPIARDHALLIHVDIRGALDTDVVTASLWHVDTVAGAELGDLCCAARDASKRRGLFADLGRPAAVTAEGVSRIELELEASLRAQGVEPPDRPLSEPERREAVRVWLQGRINVCAAHSASCAKDLVASWPAGVAPLPSSDAHSEDELELLEHVLDGVEARHTVPFGPSKPGTPTGSDRDGWLLRSLGRAFPGSTTHNTGGSS
jgi:hypothetical protein